MDNNGKIIPEIDEQNVSVQQENATFMIIGDKAYTSEIIEEYNRNAAAKTEEFNTNATNKTNDFNTNYANKLKAFNDNTTTKTTDFDSHVTAQTTNFNNNAETATANFNKNVVQQTDEFNKNAVSYSQGIEENKENIVATSNELYRLKTDVLETGETTDSLVNIEDSAWSEMQQLEIEGVCKQNTTTGKNLLKIDASGDKDDIYSVVNSGDLLCTSKNLTAGTYKVYLELFTKPTVNTTFSGYINNTNIVANDFNAINDYSLNTIYEKSITIDEDSIISYKMWGNTDKDTIKFRMWLLNADERNTAFEPYTGGQPSPSPDYPQEIKILTGNIKLTSCGKNLFDGEIELGSITPSDGILVNNNSRTRSKNFIKVKPNTTYSFTRTLGQYRWIIGYTKDKIGITDGNFNEKASALIQLNINELTVQFTTSPTTEYIKWYDTDCVDLNEEVQIEDGSTATTFEPYQDSALNITIPENEFVGKINDTYKDTLNVVYKSDGHYHLMLNKMIGKTILDGSENWNYDSNSKYFRDNTYVFEQIPLLMTSENKAMYSQLSNSFIVNKDWSGANSFRDNLNIQGEFYPVQNAGYKLAFRNLNFDNVDDFKSYLSSKNIIVVYPLETPYEVDLGIVDTLLTFDEITNIFTDSNLLPIINVKYYRNFITTIQNLQVNDKALKQELVDINNRLAALEAAQANLINDISTEESEVTE